MIWTDAKSLKHYLDTHNKSDIVLTSGFFDPLHVGHLRCIVGCKSFGSNVVVIVNSDAAAIRKKRYVFMPEMERAEIVAHLSGVTDVLIWDDGTQYVDKALEILKPNVFVKGGDRSRIEDIAECERKVCEKLNCRIELGVGGNTKVQSSSKLVGKMKNNLK